MVLERKIIATFSEQKARELYEDCRFLMPIPCIIRRKIFYFTSQTYAETN